MALKKASLRFAGRATRAARRRLIEGRLRAGRALRPGPWWVQIGIDERCNYRCAMCSVHSHLLPPKAGKNILPRDVFERLIAELRRLGTRRIEVCGSGEPMLHPEALHMLRLVKDAGMEAVLITNGSRLTPEVCREFANMSLDAVNVSVNSGTDETHHTITQAPMGERARMMDALRQLVQYREERGAASPAVSVSIVIQKANYREIVGLAREVVELDLDNIEFVSLGINEASRAMALDAEEAEEARRQVIEADAMMRAAGKTTSAESYLARPKEAYFTKEIFSQIPCHIGQFFCRINVNGDVNPCCASCRVIGNVRQQSYREIWSSPEYRAFRKEALDLPNRGRPVTDCFCYSCNHAALVVDYHRKLTEGRFSELF